MPTGVSVSTGFVRFVKVSTSPAKYICCRVSRVSRKNVKDEPLSGRETNPASRRRSEKPAQQQVARRHLVIEGTGVNAVNTVVAALILAQSQGSLLIHVADWESFRSVRLKPRPQLCLRLRWHAFSMAPALKMTERI